MTYIPTFDELLANTKVINQTKNDLLRKNLFPKHSLSYLTDPNMLKSAIYNYSVEPIRTWGCPICAIAIKGPKAWMIQHIKVHQQNKEIKENEVRESKINPYFY